MVAYWFAEFSNLKTTTATYKLDHVHQISIEWFSYKKIFYLYISQLLFNSLKRESYPHPEIEAVSVYSLPASAIGIGCTCKKVLQYFCGLNFLHVHFSDRFLVPESAYCWIIPYLPSPPKKKATKNHSMPRIYTLVMLFFRWRLNSQISFEFFWRELAISKPRNQKRGLKRGHVKLKHY